jgi:hypothetical protein
MDLRKIDPSTLSIEQKVVLHLANYGYITNVGDVMRAMVDQAYAEFLILGTGIPDIPSDPEGDGDCDHEALTDEEIQEVFDNDYYE